jgi:1-acyl-sn-glycerol-3-phosphate acyltransferase
VLVDRSNPGAGVVKKMARLVEAGHSLIVFPEGTRSLDGAVGRFKGGSFVIAVQSALPVVPITITGSRHVMLKGQVTVHRGAVALTVHEPIETKGLPREVVRELADRVRTIVSAG